MLLGEYNYAVDSKGRLNFPAKFREKMGQTFIVTKWLDNCLVAFPQEEWERMDALLEEKGMLKPRQVKRFLYAYACEVEPDKQGRILLSPSQAKPANTFLSPELTCDIYYFPALLSWEMIFRPCQTIRR